eukprot:4894521-Amphidinium_carterae.2
MINPAESHTDLGTQRIGDSLNPDLLGERTDDQTPCIRILIVNQRGMRTKTTMILKEHTTHRLQWTPELEEDLDWESEDLEEEQRERDEVVSVSPAVVRMRPPYAWLAPLVIMQRPLAAVAVQQLPRPSVIAPQPPPWEEPMAEVPDAEGEEEDDPATDTTEDYSWLWDQEHGQRFSYFTPARRIPTEQLMGNPWTERIASKAMPKRRPAQSLSMVFESIVVACLSMSSGFGSRLPTSMFLDWLPLQ